MLAGGFLIGLLGSAADSSRGPVSSYLLPDNCGAVFGALLGILLGGVVGAVVGSAFGATKAVSSLPVSADSPGDSARRSPPEQVGEGITGRVDDRGEELGRLREENARLRRQLDEEMSAEALAPPGQCPACGAVVPPEAARCPDCQIALR
jgi:hypothetical protein